MVQNATLVAGVTKKISKISDFRLKAEIARNFIQILFREAKSAVRLPNSEVVHLQHPEILKKEIQEWLPLHWNERYYLLWKSEFDSENLEFQESLGKDEDLGESEIKQRFQKIILKHSKTIGQNFQKFPVSALDDLFGDLVDVIAFIAMGPVQQLWLLKYLKFGKI
jgi:hypothetical protein